MVDFIKRLFGSNKNNISPINVETAPLSEEQLKFVTREDPIAVSYTHL